MLLSVLLAACGGDDSTGVGTTTRPGDAGSDTSTGNEPAFPPESILFIGNSFTFFGPVPDFVEALIADAGFPAPRVEWHAIAGQTLEGHRDDALATALVAEGWDVVVLQEHSTRPTDDIGPAQQFYEDATWFYDEAKTANPDAAVVLYETWARSPMHPDFYPPFDDAADMQAQLRFHYDNAADVEIPNNHLSTAPVNVVVAPVGDAYESQGWQVETEDGPVFLHVQDEWYHASSTGQYLNALVLYATIYHQSVVGRTELHVDPDVAATLQETVDSLTEF